jgi:hypothetical protein
MVFYQFLEDPFTSTSNARWATMGYVSLWITLSWLTNG